MTATVQASPRYAKYAEPVDRESAQEEDDGGLVRDVVRSSAFKDFMRTAAREIAQGMFRTGRR